MTESVPRRDNAEDGTQNPSSQGFDQSCTTNDGVSNSGVSDSIIEGSHIGRNKDRLSYPQTAVELGDFDNQKKLTLRKAELELRRVELELEQDIKARIYQRRFEAISQILTSLANLVILAAGIYLTATGKDVGAFMMGIGGAGGAMNGIQIARRQGGENNNSDKPS